MHELSITQSILDITLNSANASNAKKVNKIKIKLGQMTGCVPEYIQEYFNLVSEGTIAYGATLEFIDVPAKLECLDCGKVSNIERFRLRCEHCSSQKIKIISGKEFSIESIDIED